MISLLSLCDLGPSEPSSPWNECLMCFFLSVPKLLFSVLGCLASCSKKHDLEDDCIKFRVLVFRGVYLDATSLACWWPLTPQHIVGGGSWEGGEL